MSLAKSGAETMIQQFGENVKVYPTDGQQPEDPEDPVYFEKTEEPTEFNDHKVRLYTSASEEMMEDYGLDENTESIMYSTEDIADEGDIVEYELGSYKWIVKSRNTNQIGNGPYVFVYGMVGK